MSSGHSPSRCEVARECTGQSERAQIRGAGADQPDDLADVPRDPRPVRTGLGGRSGGPDSLLLASGITDDWAGCIP